MHINKINNKVYIGKTCQEPEKRYGCNGSGYKKCPYFYNAIQKYGWENFDHVILFSELTKDEACEKEIECIKKYNACDHQFGYNISKGGDGFDSEYSKSLWENLDYANTIIQKNKELWSNEEYKNERKKLFKEAWKDPSKRQRRSELTIKRWADPVFHEKAREAVLEACKRSVVCIETGEVFDSIKEAADKYNVCHANISRACKTNYKCGEYHWRYA